MPPILNLADLDLSGTYTYADYAVWQFTERVELIMGKAFPMAGPNARHQSASMHISASLFNHLNGRCCKVYAAPFDLILAGTDGREDTIVQPDVIVVCDPHKIQDRGCVGAPDLVVEILSPSSFRRDLNEKLRLYEHHQVKEYWTVDLSRKFILIHILGPGGKFLPPEISTENDVLSSRLFPGLALDLHETFDNFIKEPEPVYGVYPEGMDLLLNHRNAIPVDNQIRFVGSDHCRTDRCT